MIRGAYLETDRRVAGQPRCDVPEMHNAALVDGSDTVGGQTTERQQRTGMERETRRVLNNQLQNTQIENRMSAT